MLGYSHHELKSLYVWDWDARWTREQHLGYASAESDSSGLLIETRFRRKDGRIIDVEISSNRVEWRGQSLIYAVCRDISQPQAG